MANLALLKEKIDDSGITYTALAKKLGIDRVTLYNRFNGIGNFTFDDAEVFVKVLNLSKKERDDIFFAKNVN